MVRKKLKSMLAVVMVAILVLGSVNLTQATAAAEAADIHVYENYTIISFNQYMDPAFISNIGLIDAEGNAVAYTVSYDKSETDAKGNVYAKTFTLTYDNANLAKGDSLRVTIPEQVKSSGGKLVSGSVSTIEAKSDISMTIGNVVHVKQGDSIDLPYTVSGVQNAVVSVTIENPDLVELVRASGNVITVTGKVYGSTRMHVVLENTGVEKIIDIKVDTYSSIETKDTAGGNTPQQPDTKPDKKPDTKPDTNTDKTNGSGQTNAPFTNGAVTDTALGCYQVKMPAKRQQNL